LKNRLSDKHLSLLEEALSKHPENDCLSSLWGLIFSDFSQTSRSVSYILLKCSRQVEKKIPLDILLYGFLKFDEEYSYLIISAIVDNLGFPDHVTSLASFLLISLFEAVEDRGKEIIVRSLLERLIVHRPHPWGIMKTLVELIKTNVNFLELPFTKVTKEVEHVFRSLSKSCSI
jgi:CCR4-NOT transcription complex subunit 1